jgi:hypothetical protein
MLSPFFLACMLLGMAVTFVRSSYLGLLVAWVVGLIMAGQREGRWKRIFAVVIVASVVISVMPKSKGDAAVYDESVSTSTLVADRMLTMAEPGKVGSFTLRTAMWQRIINHSFMYPQGVGLGAGSASRISGNYILSAMAYTESQVFSMLAELGWAGFLLYLWIVIYGLIYSLKIYDHLEDEQLKQLVRALVMLQVGISVSGVSGGPVLYTLPGNAYYWAALGMVTAIARMNHLVVEKKKIGPTEAVA